MSKDVKYTIDLSKAIEATAAKKNPAGGPNPDDTAPDPENQAPKPGDKVHVKGDSQFHPNHRGKVGTVKACSTACAIAFDEDPDRVQKWFVGDDLVNINQDGK